MECEVDRECDGGLGVLAYSNSPSSRSAEACTSAVLTAAVSGWTAGVARTSAVLSGGWEVVGSTGAGGDCDVLCTFFFDSSVLRT